MPKRVVDSCLLERERNYISFEICERTVAELKSFLFKTIFHWTAATNLNAFILLNFLFYFL
jgi:hypothetical protein